MATVTLRDNKGQTFEVDLDEPLPEKGDKVTWNDGTEDVGASVHERIYADGGGITLVVRDQFKVR